jgi:hypothetical protein
MKEYNSIYLGVVVQNNDPEKRGRVKVFVPHITATVYKNLIQDKTNKNFNFVGDNIDSDLTPIIGDLKKILPWAEISSPLTSENTSGRFNNFNLKGGISDSNFYTNFTESSATSPGEIYEKNSFRLNDAFTGEDEKTNNPNPYSYMYRPSTYSNKAKGSFGIPAVGSHVYVFFRDGNPNFPTVIGVSFGQSDWNGIYDNSLDYPGKFENYSQSITEDDVNVNNYRNKYVLNQKGGVFEIINSDLNEKIKLTHYSGSFKEFNNNATVELATKNDQKLVLNDQYTTVKGNKNEYTGKNLDTIVVRDNYRKIGNLNKEYFQKWKDIASVIQDNKQLFEIRRSVNNDVKDLNGNVIIKRNSYNQIRKGDFIDFEITNGSKSYKALSNTDTAPGNGYNLITNSSGDGPSGMNDEKLIASNTSQAPEVSRWEDESGKPFTNGKGKSLSSKDGNWEIEDKKDELKNIIDTEIKKLLDIELELGLGGSEIVEISKHKLETIGVLMNDFGSIRLDKIGKLINNEVLIDDKGVYVNKSESPLLEYVHVQDLPGGNYTLNVCNRYNVMVGAGGLSMKSYGPVNISGTITNIAGEQINLGSDNEINIDANTINISAEILRLRNKRQRQILIENSLGVNKNVIIGGGLHIEGETFLQHVTAPKEWQRTELTRVFAKLLTGLSFSGTLNGTGTVNNTTQTVSFSNVTFTLASDSNDNKVQCYDHSHAFVNLPLTLKDTNEEVRQAAKELNSGEERSVAEPQHNEYKG